MSDITLQSQDILQGTRKAEYEICFVDTIDVYYIKKRGDTHAPIFKRREIPIEEREQFTGVLLQSNNKMLTTFSLEGCTSTNINQLLDVYIEDGMEQFLLALSDINKGTNNDSVSIELKEVNNTLEKLFNGSIAQQLIENNEDAHIERLIGIRHKLEKYGAVKDYIQISEQQREVMTRLINKYEQANQKPDENTEIDNLRKEIVRLQEVENDLKTKYSEQLKATEKAEHAEDHIRSSLRQANVDYNELYNEYQELNKSTDVLRNELVSLKFQLARQEKANQMSQEAEDSARKSLGYARMDIDELSDEVKNLKDQLKNKEHSELKLREEINVLENRLEKEELAKLEIQKGKAEFVSFCGELWCTIHDNQYKLNKLQSEINDLTITSTAQKLAYEAAQSALVRKLDNSVSLNVHNEKVTELEQQVAILEHDFVELENEADTYTDKIVELEDKLVTLNDKYKDLSIDYTLEKFARRKIITRNSLNFEILNYGKDKEICELREELYDTSEQLRILQIDLSDYERKISYFRDEKEKDSQIISNLRMFSDMEDLYAKQTLEKEQKKSSYLEQELAKMTLINSINEDHIKHCDKIHENTVLNMQINNEKVVREYENQIVTLKAEIESLQEKQNSLQMQLADAEYDVVKLSTDNEQTKYICKALLENLSEKNRDLTNENLLLETQAVSDANIIFKQKLEKIFLTKQLEYQQYKQTRQLEKSLNKTTEMSKMLSKLEEVVNFSNDDYKFKLTEKDTMIDELSLQINDFKERISQLELMAESKTFELRNTNKSLQLVKSYNDDLTKDNAYLKQQIDKLTKSINSSNEAKAKLMSENSELSARINDANDELDKLTEELDNLTNEHVKLKDSFAKLHDEYNDMDDYAGETENKYLELKDVYSAQLNKIEAMSEELRNASDEYTDIEQQLLEKEKLLQDSKQQITSLTELVSKHDNEIINLNNEILSWKKTVKQENFKATLLGTQNGKLKSELSKEKSMTSDLSYSVIQLKAELGEKEAEIKEKDERHEKMKLALTDLIENLAQFKNNKDIEIRELHDKINSLTNQLNSKIQLASSDPENNEYSI